MHPQLEALIRAYDAFIQAGHGSEAPHLFEVYESLLEHSAAGASASKELLHRSVKRQYTRWLRANAHPTTLPPAA